MAAKTAASVRRFRSYPPPFCQKRNRSRPGRSRTVNLSSNGLRAATSPCLIRVENGRLIAFRMEQVDPDLGPRRDGHQMDMLGHEDEGHQIEEVALHCPADALREQAPPHLVGQQRHPVVA